MSKQFYFKQFCLAWVHSLQVKTILFQAIQFSLSMLLSSIWPIDRALSGATNPGQSWPGSYGNEGILCIPQISNNTVTSSSNCLVSYQDTHWSEVLPSAEMPSVYSTAPADWARVCWWFNARSLYLVKSIYFFNAVNDLSWIHKTELYY